MRWIALAAVLFGCSKEPTPAEAPRPATASTPPSQPTAATPAPAPAAKAKPKVVTEEITDGGISEEVESRPLMAVLRADDGNDGRDDGVAKRPAAEQTGPGSRVKVGAVTVSGSTLDTYKVKRRIRSRYLRGAKVCHRRVLVTKPTVQGVATVTITVGPAGKVTESKVRSFDGSFDRCLAQQIRRWRFSAPKAENGDPTSAKVTVEMTFAVAPRSGD